MDWKTLYLTANGRLGQRDFWIAWAIVFAASLVASVIPLIGPLVALALVVPNVCITSKRLHDFGRTGWLAAVPYAAGAVVGAVGAVTGGAAMMAGGLGGRGLGAAAMMGSMGLMAFLGLAVFVIAVGFLLWVGLTRGDAQPNAYGPQPAPVFGAGTTATPV
jgi:uncharacterized membrane protein YhaH (DUF805 family)